MTLNTHESWRVENGRVMCGGVTASASKIVETITTLQAKLSVTLAFCEVSKCRGCDGYYPLGYVCECGEDNSVNPTKEL